MEATLKQSAHNNKLKKACIDNEENIMQLHVGEYTDKVQYELFKAHDKANIAMASMSAGMKWNLSTSYDVKKLMRQCGLELALNELCRTDGSPNYFDLLPLKKEMNLQRKAAIKVIENRPFLQQANFVDCLRNCCEYLDEIETLFKTSQLDATDYARIPKDMIPKLKGLMEFQTVAVSLAEVGVATTENAGMVQQMKDIQAQALLDGDMTVAEEQAYNIIATLEKSMELVGDKFQIINNKEEEKNYYADVFSICSESNRNTLVQKNAQRRLKQRCESDLNKVHERITTADAQDVQALKAWAKYIAESDKMIKETEAKIVQLFKDLHKNKYTMLLDDIDAELRATGRKRNELVMDRIEKTEKEELRKVEYTQFLEVVALHKRTLEVTIDNCDLAVTCLGKFEQILDELASCLREWHDIVAGDLYALRIQVHKEHLGYFREMYLCIGDLLYKKEKKIEGIDAQLRREHIQLEFCIETFDLTGKQHSDAKKELTKMRNETAEEVEMLKGKAETAMEEFLESEEALKEEGFDFVHPAVEFQDMVMNQREKISQYKAQYHKEEEVRITAEREEIRRLVAMSPNKGMKWSGTPGGTSPKKLEYGAE